MENRTENFQSSNQNNQTLTKKTQQTLIQQQNEQLRPSSISNRDRSKIRILPPSEASRQNASQERAIEDWPASIWRSTALAHLRRHFEKPTATKKKRQKARLRVGLWVPRGYKRGRIKARPSPHHCGQGRPTVGRGRAGPGRGLGAPGAGN